MLVFSFQLLKGSLPAHRSCPLVVCLNSPPVHIEEQGCAWGWDSASLSLTVGRTARNGSKMMLRCSLKMSQFEWSFYPDRNKAERWKLGLTLWKHNWREYDRKSSCGRQTRIRIQKEALKYSVTAMGVGRFRTLNSRLWELLRSALTQCLILRPP